MRRVCSAIRFGVGDNSITTMAQEPIRASYFLVKFVVWEMIIINRELYSVGIY